MSGALKTTFRVLGATENEAASRVLVAALDSPHAAIRQAALEVILSRRSPAGRREVVARLHALDERSRKIVAENPSRLTPALRDAILGGEEEACRNGCAAAVWLCQYDLIPALLNALEDGASPQADLLGKMLLELVDLLCGELAAPREYGKRRDPQVTRHHVLGSLELSLGRFAKHRRREILEAFARLARSDNAALRQILDNPHHPAFVMLVETFSKSTHPSVIRLLLAFLDDPRAPSAVLSIVSKRSDLELVEYLLRKIGRQPSAAVAQNRKRIESFAWVRGGGAALDQLDDLAQHAAVRLVTASSLPRDQAFGVIAYLVRQGKPSGRRAAAEALAAFHGAAANDLALEALDDPDPEVQAKLLPQLRQRGIPGALNRLVEMLDSPHGAVRKAARKSLGEFTFQRFLRNFDMLDEEVRQSTGELVRKVDPHTVPQLRAELASPLRTRRLRALAIARTLDLGVEIESSLLDVLGDEDHMVRAEVAAALGQCRSPASRDALWEASRDRSVVVREAARKSLQRRGETAPQGPLVPAAGEQEELRG